MATLCRVPLKEEVHGLECKTHQNATESCFHESLIEAFRWGKVNKDREEVVRELLAKWLRMLQREKALRHARTVIRHLQFCHTTEPYASYPAEHLLYCYTAIQHLQSITLSALGAGHWRGYSSADSELGCVLRRAVFEI